MKNWKNITAQRDWEAYRKNLVASTPVPQETVQEKSERIRRLEKDPFEWYRYYFPKYCTSDFADFQKRSSRRVLKNDELYMVKPWAREHAKSVISMMDELYLMMTGKLKNMLMVSYSFDNAVELAMPTIINLESNNRLINDYGHQVGLGSWANGKWVTCTGISIRAIGLGQNPRGTRNEEKRPDYIRLDDADSDELCRNPERVKNAWRWVERALFPCMSITGSKRFIFVGNIIAKDSIITRAMEKADYAEVVNILDKNNEPTWKERYTIAQVNYMLSKMSYIAQQQEYFNNPITEGTVFKVINHKRLEPLNRYKFLVAYGDPSFKSGKKNDFKAIALVGFYKGEYHVLKAYCLQTTSNEMAKWYKYIHDYVDSKTPLYCIMESNATQDLIYDQVTAYIAENEWGFSISADTRQKGDKFSRIESLLEPLNSQGKLWFNEKEKTNEHMQRGVEQMEALEPALSAHDDFPDALHGAVSIIKEKTIAAQPAHIGNIAAVKKRSKHF